MVTMKRPYFMRLSGAGQARECTSTQVVPKLRTNEMIGVQTGESRETIIEEMNEADNFNNLKSNGLLQNEGRFISQQPVLFEIYINFSTSLLT